MKTNPDPLQDARFEKVIARLRRQEAPEPSSDFAARTMARLKPSRARRRSLSGIAIRVAATLALLLGAGWWLVRESVWAPVAKNPSPIDILMAAQRSDGGWSADAQNLRPRYDVGVTALALLALMQTGPSPLEAPQGAAIRSGMDHLIRQQRLDGRFGEDFSGAGFTHYLAGMAARTAARLPGADPAWREAAIRAEQHLPAGVQIAKLNANLAHPETFPSRWTDAGGTVTRAALQMLGR